MLKALSRPSLSTLATLIAVLFFALSPVYGQDTIARKDILKGTKGESSCDLHTALSHCGKKQTSQTTRELDERAIPSVTPVPPANLCTCNDIAFNIWSACTYTFGYNDMPIFNDWIIRCGNSTVNVMDSQALSRRPGGLAIEVPTWATVPVPGGRFFDIQAAVILAHATEVPTAGGHGSTWSTVQIVLPIITAIASALMMLLVFLVFRRRYTIPSLPTYQANKRSNHGMVRLSSLSNLKAESIHGTGDEPVQH